MKIVPHATRAVRLFACLVAFGAFLPIVAAPSKAPSDFIKVRYLPGYVMTGYPVELVIHDSYQPGNPVIQRVYGKLKELEKAGRLEFAWPDAPSITIEVHYQGKVIKSTISPHQSVDSDEFSHFARTWHEAYAIVWKAVEPRMKAGQSKPR